MANGLHVEYRIIRRQCGGFLAISVSADAPRIGVFADTEEEAVNKLATTLSRWREILDGAKKPACYAISA
jgi:hypothetical protein